MEVETHHINDSRIAEVISDKIIINNVEDGLDLLGNYTIKVLIKL